MRKGQVLLVYVVILVFWALIVVGFTLWDRAYKQGQIDYANGIIKYELKQQANMEKVWQEKN
jgi:uncharacterized membrane protein